MHKLYIILSYCLIPIVFVNTFIRVLIKKEDKNRFKERFGQSTLDKPKNKDLIWIHAASLGEFKSSDFIINNYFETYSILVTTTTKAASEYAIKNYSNKIIHQFAPYDILFWINKFLKKWEPKLVIWIESDLWPNTIISLRKKKIKSIFLNARISPKSYERWRFFSSYYNYIIQSFSAVFAQSKNDIKRIKSLSNINVQYLGNLKLSKKKYISFDSNTSQNTRIMIASTHDNEEKIILPYLEIVAKKYPLCEFIIVPRHPERSSRIFDLLKSRNLEVDYYSKKINENCKFLIIDSFGKMDECFFKSDIVFLGGSFTKNGGHNPIEAARAQCAIITGPNVFNWQNLYEEMNENKACYMIKKPKELEVIISKFIENNNLLKNYKDNALNYSNKTFFEEQKLIEILNKSLENHA